jgi:alkaline phosphatase
MVRFTFLVAVTLLVGQPGLAQTVLTGPSTSAQYREQGAAELARLRAARPIEGRARNVIIFIGDGMGVSTLTAARIHQGQIAGVDGVSFVPAMDRLRHTALVKTYSHDSQVADSAPTATAILAGIKTWNGAIGIGPEARPGDCASGRGRELPSLVALAQASGRATGVVSTTRITHATPAATYAHTVDRDWEADADLPAEARAAGCKDIARQMMENPEGARLDVILGGGRRMLLPTTTADPEYADRRGSRTDRRNLIEEWRRRTRGRFVWNAEQFAALNPKRDRRVLGLFEPDHMRYEADRRGDKAGEPSLAEMTRAAINILRSDPDGFVLMVEGGRIDHAHHDGNARRALEDTIALDDAVRTVLEMVDLENTLVVVTSDHSHAFTISGYPARENPILGVAASPVGQPSKAQDGKPYTTLGYANGPGAVTVLPRPDPAAGDTTALDFRQQSLVPLGSETHGGEDVVVRASGPMAHLFGGTIEQHTIFHVVNEALGGSAK